MSLIFRYLGMIFLLFMTIQGHAQNDRKAISFQGILKQNETLLINQTLYFRLGLFSDTLQTALYEEVQDTLSNEFALFNINLGKGTVTGDALTDDYDQVLWSDPMWLKIEFRLNEVDDFELLGTRKFQAMPFAMHAEFASGEGVGTNDLFDVVNNGEVEFILKWDGEKWMSNPDAMYAWNTFNSDTSIYSDTALYAWNMLYTTPTDTVYFAYYTDTIAHSIFSDTSLHSIKSIYADTAFIAFTIQNTWTLNGNAGNNQLGSLDSTDFVIKSNNQEVIRATAIGEVLMNGTNNFHADLQTKGTVVFQGVHEPYSLDTLLNNAFYWEPRKSSMIIGNEMATYFVDTLGRYSFAGGRKSLANSFSFAWGDSCIASGNNMAVFGKNNVSARIGLIRYATGLIFGRDNYVYGLRTTALGVNHYLSSTASGILIGTNTKITTGGNLINIGNYIVNSGLSSFMIGNYLKSSKGVGSSKSGCLFIGDYSTSTYLENTNDIQYQLLVRAAGGTTIYSDSLSSSGVVLYTGSGSWSMLSDRNSKENTTLFEWDNNQSILFGLIKFYFWNYKSQDNSLIHFGAMAQELNKSFELNEDYRRLNMIDMDGLTYSGIGYLLELTENHENCIGEAEDNFRKINLKRQRIFEILDNYELIQKEGKL